MFSRFDILSNLPKPSELFTNKAKPQDTETTPIREGLTSNTNTPNTNTPNTNTPNTNTTKNTKKTDDILSGKTTLITFLITVFIILFVVIGLIYYFNSNLLMMKQLMIPYTNSEYWINFKGQLVASKVTIFIILWMIVFGMNLFLMDMVFKNNEIDNIFYVTTIFYWSIMGSTMLLIGNIPSLVDVFENTIGYSVLSSPFYNLDSVMSMFKNRNFKSDTIKISYNFLITTFNIPSFHDYFNELCSQYPSNEEYKTGSLLLNEKPKSDFYIDLNTWLSEEEEPGTERQDTNLKETDQKTVYARQELLKCVLTKNMIGHFVWVLLASYVTVLLTMNTIVK